jgi:hypothetical protein
MQSHIFKYLAVAGLTLTGVFASQLTARALNLSYDGSSSSGNTYVYDLTLAAGESISSGEILDITGLSGITNVTATSIYDDTLTNFNSGIDVTFTASTLTTNITGSSFTYDNAIILTSTSNTLGTINYEGYSNQGVFNTTTTGPVAAGAAVPFEFSPGLGLILSTGLFGCHMLRRKLTAV